MLATNTMATMSKLFPWIQTTSNRSTCISIVGSISVGDSCDHVSLSILATVLVVKIIITIHQSEVISDLCIFFITDSKIWHS